MLAEFSIYPMDGAHMSADVAELIKILEASKVDYRLGPMSTSVEGDWDEVMKAIGACHRAVTQAHPRVITSVLIDDRKEGTHHLDEMVARVEQHLGHAAKH